MILFAFFFFLTTSTFLLCNKKARLVLFVFDNFFSLFFPVLHRTQDIKTKKHHIPLVDRTPLEPPPVVVVVMGPPKVGKSTLIRCLVKNYTRQKLSDICGPVTIVSGELVIVLMHSQEAFSYWHSLFYMNIIGFYDVALNYREETASDLYWVQQRYQYHDRFGKGCRFGKCV